MILVGLTGSIGMGKSTVGRMLEDLGAAYWDADSAVHRLYAKDGAGVGPVGEIFPSAVKDGVVDRTALAKIVLGDTDELKKLEAIIHPLVARDREEFLAASALNGIGIVVLDIPLLFENNAEALFHEVVVVTAPADVQRARVLARPGMTENKLDAILEQQIPDDEKRKRADYVIDTSVAIEETRREVARVFEVITQRHEVS